MSTTPRQRAAARAASLARIKAMHAETRRVAAAGICPECGLPVRHNTSLTGWWQCVANASPRMRALEYRDAPACSWQGFTE